MQRTKGFTIVAVWYIISAFLYFATALVWGPRYNYLSWTGLAIGNLLIIMGFMGFVNLIGTFFVGIGGYTGVALIMFVIYIILPVLGILSFVVAYGLWKRKDWGWTWASVLAIIGVIISIAGMMAYPWDTLTGFSLTEGMLVGPWSLLGFIFNLAVALYSLSRLIALRLMVCMETGCGKMAAYKFRGYDGQGISLCEEHYKEWIVHREASKRAEKMKKQPKD